ncbi:MAG TPA: L-serine ammonia-lyase, iron-sulfur-dependent, subunit alpha [Candidatus Woesebacteria bacterium]|nr:L-serine ammonia-lyase, iron-sulfur-dependent, subunit alpha [Candidatus Woesebacteria bacterium]
MTTAQTLVNFIDLFDIMGPVMIGPSSSHTAGAAKIGYFAFQLLGDSPKKIRIKLFNSFSDTGKGHKTDLALLGGCIGISPDDERLLFSIEQAKAQKLEFKIKWGYHSSDLHPNTAIIELESANFQVGVVGYSIGGGRIQIIKQYRRPIGGLSNSKKSSSLDETIFQNNHNKSKSTAHEKYFTFQELSDKAKSGKQLMELIVTIQAQSHQQTSEKILEELERRWLIMVGSVAKGVSNYRRSQNKMFGGDAYRIRRSKLNILNDEIENSIYYSIGVAEHNARMGKIVAAPTAGSAGIMPGVLRSLQEKFYFSDKQMAKALLIAGGIGAVIANKTELAGAVGGCQAEIGAAGAMTAAAGTYLLKGNSEAIEAAASLVLANLLGLTCDPVMGLVEVPCILRNGMVASMVMAAIEIALDGVRYPIPFDEVVDVMKKVGDDMHSAYKETSTGGLAQTTTARSMCRGCQKCD